METKGSSEVACEVVTGTLLTVREFSRKHNWPEGGLRHLLFYRPDGFSVCVRRVGRKILINERAFFDWVERINAKKLNF